jgi:hypothetical protein
VEGRLNSVKLAVIVSLIGRSLDNLADSMQLFENALTNKSKMDQDAVLCLEMDIVLLWLKNGDLEASKQKLDEYETSIVSKQTTEAVAFSKYYRALAAYKKVSSLWYTQSL